MQRPSPDEYDSMFEAYVNRVAEGSVVDQLRHQVERSRMLFQGLSEEQGNFAYAPDKWSVKRLLQHLTDGERMFCYRAMCIARGDTVELPGFDEVPYAENDGSEARTLTSILEDFLAVRAATLTLFGGFADAVWTRRGIANGSPVTVRALLWIIAGHELHHTAVLRERYNIGIE